MYIAIDIGGNNVRVASSSSITKPRLKIIKFKTSQSYKEDLSNIVASINQLKSSKKIKIQGIALSAASGAVDKNKKCITAAVNLNSWISQPVCHDLERIFKCKTLIEMDSCCSALGEALYGYGQKQNFTFVIWGTGIGAAWVQHINNKINIPSFQAGHQIIDWCSKRICGCGQTGCLEAFCGGRNIKKYYHSRAGDLLQKDWSNVAEHMAQGLINIIWMHPVKLIVFSGGVAISQAKKLKDVERFMHKRLRVFPVPQLKISKYGDNIALYGALGLFRNVLI